MSSEKRRPSLGATYLRLLLSLKWFMRFLPLTVVSIVAASAAPALFRWYAGKYLSLSPASRVSPGVLSAWVFDWGVWASFPLDGLLLIMFGGTVFRILAWVSFEVTGMWSSGDIHRQMFRGLSRVRVTFFDENPSGSVMSRLIKDFDELRSTAIIFVGDLLNSFIEVLSIAGVACFASPVAGLFVLPLLGCFFVVQSQRSLMIEHCRRMTAVQGGELLNRKNDLTEGRETFLIYGKSDQLLEGMTLSLRKYLRASWLGGSIEIWSSFWIRVLSETFSFIVLIFTAQALMKHQIEVPLAGVIISALFGVTGSVGWLDFSANLVSRSLPHVTRAFEYVDLPEEEKEERPEIQILKPRARFDTKGSYGIEFSDFSFSYHPHSPIILDRISLRIQEGEKLALVGRTGSGKSTLIQGLLRMGVLRGGDLKIGGQSLYDYPAQETRRIFGIVPQNPYLFRGSIRSNLDRSGKVSAKALENALERVGLPHGLADEVSEGGSNFSVGERQLICLARAIANRRSIVLMDEPTSALDPLTDVKITTVLRKSLEGNTVITIAHRLESLKFYDRTIELAQGQIVRSC